MNHLSAAILPVAVFVTVTGIVTGIGFHSSASAQPADGEEPESLPLDDQPIDDMVAAALAARSQLLYDSGDYANAKKLSIESLERSPEGPSAKGALETLRSSNQKLGISNLEDGRPVKGAVEAPVDPYASTDQPVDPYADDPGADNADPVDPYLAPGGEADVPDVDEPNRRASRGLMAWGAGWGFSLGMAIGGPVDENDEVRGGALLLGVAGLAGGVAGGYFASRRYPLSRGQVAAIASAGNWGMWNLGMFGDVVHGEGTGSNEVYKFVAAGGALGVGAGAYYAIKAKPSEGDVAMFNSLGAYGTTAGLLFAVAVSPPRADAYSLNAVLGSVGGLGLGLILRDQFEMSRARTLRIDLGAATGLAATWGLLYPLIADDGTNNDEQFAGFFSTLTMAGGIAVAYWLTRNYDKKKSDRLLAESDPYPAPVGLIRRSGSGTWSLGSPMLRPLEAPALAPRTGFSLGVDVAGGRF